MEVHTKSLTTFKIDIIEKRQIVHAISFPITGHVRCSRQFASTFCSLLPLFPFPLELFLRREDVDKGFRLCKCDKRRVKESRPSDVYHIGQADSLFSYFLENIMWTDYVT